jgi:amino acid permease
MLVEMPEYIQKFYTPGVIEYAIWDFNLFVGAAITFFSFTCQASIIPIYSELVNPNEKRMMKVIGRSLAVDCAFYCAIALVGYFSTFADTP